MNYLAHIFLSLEDPDIMFGNFLADMIPLKEEKKYNKKIQKGMNLHRAIDSFTDSHPIVKQTNKRLHKRHKKYAPVVSDVLYDYYLSNNWNKYSKVSLQVFCDQTYMQLMDRIDIFPEPIKKHFPNWVNSNWLARYGTIEGITKTLEYLDKRTRFPSNFTLALDDIKDFDKELNSDFNQFFPELVDFVKSY